MFRFSFDRADKLSFGSDIIYNLETDMDKIENAIKILINLGRRLITQNSYENTDQFRFNFTRIEFYNTLDVLDIFIGVLKIPDYRSKINLNRPKYYLYSSELSVILEIIDLFNNNVEFNNMVITTLELNIYDINSLKYLGSFIKNSTND